ncbi:MAG TPA: serine/threonine-protein kinase, partial [Blastocatellia bacterium]|nr:serine/threonine-protein kinase [Blastocatellia bacterium]
YVVIASEYAPDGSLQGWLNRHGGQAPSIEAAVEMTRGILAGLEHLHQRRIIHRDLKPDNILLQGETPRLADFGISRVVKSTSLSANLAGTPAYMAPEAFQKRRNEQTDLWSVGVILYQMLSGRLPFEGDDLPTACVAVRDEEPAPLPAAVPVWLQQIVTRALLKDPGQRYQSATEMRRDLAEAKLRQERQEAERLREEEERRRREQEAQLQAERERLLRENAELRRLAEKQRQSDAAKQTVKIPLPPTVPAPQPQPDRRARIFVIVAALMLTAGLAFWLAPKLFSDRPGVKPEQVEVLRYALELKGWKDRVTTFEPVQGRQFRLHFIPRERGFLYLLSPDEQQVLRTFLTAQQIEAGADFVFPGGGQWIELPATTGQVRITAIFSEQPVRQSPFCPAMPDRR